MVFATAGALEALKLIDGAVELAFNGCFVAQDFLNDLLGRQLIGKHLSFEFAIRTESPGGDTSIGVRFFEGARIRCSVETARYRSGVRFSDVGR